MSEKKVCTKCDIEYEHTPEFFHKRKNGLSTYCKKCQCKMTKAIADKMKECGMKYIRSPESLKRKNKNYYEKNKEKLKEKRLKKQAEKKAEVEAPIPAVVAV